MGKKSREKRERKLARLLEDSELPLRHMLSMHQQFGRQSNQASPFADRVTAMRGVLAQYAPLDAALALGVSELWPPNAGSPVKHIFAWDVFLSVPSGEHGDKRINTYADFQAFILALQSAWPQFPNLEDYSPEADWGHTKVRLGSAFVPVFYGSSIERVPDFIEAFRITYAHVPEALAHMDLAVALQARIIGSMPHLATASVMEAEPGGVETPPEDFWSSMRATLQDVGDQISDWRSSAASTGSVLETQVGEFDAPLSWDNFGDAVMLGSALPFLAVTIEGRWLPMSVRSAPGVIIDHWAQQKVQGDSPETHRRLGDFVAERSLNSVAGPLGLVIGGEVCEDLPISSVTSSGSGVYLICACEHRSLSKRSAAAKNAISKVRSGGLVKFRVPGAGDLLLSADGKTGPSASELRIALVPTIGSTAFSSLTLPGPPIRLLPLCDFLTIFDSLTTLDELEEYWSFFDSQNSTLMPFSRAPVDVFASFRQSHGVLVEGAVAPTMISLDPHWGTTWRFQVLADFWARAPRVFPDNSPGWCLDEGSRGVVELKSRSHRVIAYSTMVGECTVQAVVEVVDGLAVEDGRMLDLFAQIVADFAHRSKDLLVTAPLFQWKQVLLVCRRDPSSALSDPERVEPSPAPILVSVAGSASVAAVLYLHIDVRAVAAGLTRAKNAAFEARCVEEVLTKGHSALGTNMPEGLADQILAKGVQPARFTLSIGERLVDVPDHPKPVVPNLSDYKLARRQLAQAMHGLGMKPGRYVLVDAKAKIDPASARLRRHLEERLAVLDRDQLVRACIEQHDALLATERIKIQRTRHSLSHDVDYDRVEAAEEARKNYGSLARHYRYLLEKTVSSPKSGTAAVTDSVLRELVGLVDWFMVMAGASDVLHNGLDVGGVVIDDSYVPEIFYSEGSEDRDTDFARVYAGKRLGLGERQEDVVEGASDVLLASQEFKHAFEADLGFDLQDLLAALAVLSQAQRYGFSEKPELSYAATPARIAQSLLESIEGITLARAEKIVEFLTLSERGVLTLAGRDVQETDVPYWEHSKRIHRYAIRPLIGNASELRWGAEAASRCMYNWMSSVRDGYLPADFGWPNIEAAVRGVKADIEKRLEIHSEKIFRRHAPYVERGIDFFRRFRSEGFEDAGDFDVFAYWPEENLVVTVECKYNQPAYTVKDGRRLRDRIFGKAEDDKAGQMSKMLRRRKFLESHRARMLELLRWPSPQDKPARNVELYVSRDVYYWMVHPPYPVTTEFVLVSMLDSWLKDDLFVAS